MSFRVNVSKDLIGCIPQLEYHHHTIQAATYYDKASGYDMMKRRRLKLWFAGALLYPFIMCLDIISPADAASTGVCPLFSSAFASPPCFSNHRTSSRCPHLAAPCNGTRPWTSHALTSALCSRSISATSRRPVNSARCRAVDFFCTAERLGRLQGRIATAQRQGNFRSMHHVEEFGSSSPGD